MTITDFSRILERYETMQRLSEQMLEHAKQGNWEVLAQTAVARDSIEEEVRQADTLAWRGAPAAKKEESIRAILALDARTRALAESRMKELRQAIVSIGTEKKLHKTYGS